MPFEKCRSFVQMKNPTVQIGRGDWFTFLWGGVRVLEWLEF